MKYLAPVLGLLVLFGHTPPAAATDTKGDRSVDAHINKQGPDLASDVYFQQPLLLPHKHPEEGH